MADVAETSEGGAAGEGLERSAAGRPCRVDEFIPSAMGSSSPPGEVNGVRAGSSQHGARGVLSGPHSVTAQIVPCGLRSYKDLKLFPSPGTEIPLEDIKMCLFGSLASPCFPVMDRQERTSLLSSVFSNLTSSQSF